MAPAGFSNHQTHSSTCQCKLLESLQDDSFDRNLSTSEKFISLPNLWKTKEGKSGLYGAWGTCSQCQESSSSVMLWEIRSLALLCSISKHCLSMPDQKCQIPSLRHCALPRYHTGECHHWPQRMYETNCE